MKRKQNSKGGEETHSLPLEDDFLFDGGSSSEGKKTDLVVKEEINYQLEMISSSALSIAQISAGKSLLSTIRNVACLPDIDPLMWDRLTSAFEAHLSDSVYKCLLIISLLLFGNSLVNNQSRMSSLDTIRSLALIRTIINSFGSARKVEKLSSPGLSALSSSASPSGTKPIQHDVMFRQKRKFAGNESTPVKSVIPIEESVNLKEQWPQLYFSLFETEEVSEEEQILHLTVLLLCLFIRSLIESESNTTAATAEDELEEDPTTRTRKTADGMNQILYEIQSYILFKGQQELNQFSLSFIRSFINKMETISLELATFSNEEDVEHDVKLPTYCTKLVSISLFADLLELLCVNNRSNQVTTVLFFFYFQIQLYSFLFVAAIGFYRRL
jgi:hypothetical protein